MDAALYGLFGTIAGSLLTGLVTVLTNRHQRELRRIELVHDRESRAHETRTQSLRSTTERYAVFLAGCWQAERYSKEIIDALRRADKKAVGRINGITASAGYLSTITALNESLGWISISCRDPGTEAIALHMSTLHDKLMDEIAVEFEAFCNENRKPNMEQIDIDFAHFTAELPRMSAVLRNDLDLDQERPRS